MIDAARTSRRAGAAGLLALAGFWVLVVVAGLLQPGYAPSRDYVSDLAAVGARDPAVGVVALLALGVAYLAAAVVLDGWVGTRLGAVLLAVAALLTWVVAFARIDCPDGAAYCSVPRPGRGVALVHASGSRFGPHLHGWGVAASYAAVALAMLWLGVLWRRRRHPLRALASVAALVTSLATVPFWVSDGSPGLAQRVWLGILTAWVVLVCVRPLVDTREDPP